MGNSPYFQIIILSEEVGLSKPDTNIFKLALEKANIQVNRVAYVGDRYDNDICPAKSLGMVTVRMMLGLGKYMMESEEWKSDYRLESLQDLITVFREKEN